ncbi:MAG: dihydrofolate reductase [Aestuariibacter sp.]|nr:dihydrofolate reductase [Aestuariibacter sp.]
MSDETQIENFEQEEPLVDVENDGEFPEGHDDDYLPPTVEGNDGNRLQFDLIVGSTLDGWIGTPNGNLPFRQSADLKNFKALTTDNVVIMGRKTLDSIGRLLPNRLNVIMTKDPINLSAWLEEDEKRLNGAPQPLIVASFAELERRLPDYIDESKKLFIIGGDSIYKQALVELDVQRIWHTVVQTTIAEASAETGWARFDVPSDYVELMERGTYPADDKNQFPYVFRALTKKA